MMKIHCIAIESIDTADERYRITLEADIDRLTVSIRSVGMLVPPIVEPCSYGYRLISGFERVRAAGMLAWDRLYCRVLEPPAVPVDSLMMAIAENVFTRRLSVFEQARTAAKLEEYFSDPEEIAGKLNALGLSVNSRLVRKYLRLHRLPEMIRQCVIDDIFSMGIALELENVDIESAIAVAELFSGLKPTTSQQKELLSSLRDIAAREELPMAVLLEEPVFKNITLDEKTDRNRKIAAMRSAVRNRRYPVLSRMESAFNRRLDFLDLPEGIRLHAPRDFESPEYVLSINFNSTNDLEEKADRLQAVCRNPELEAMLKREIED